jgi:hypothetical protein
VIDDAVAEAIDAAGFESLSPDELKGGRRIRGGGKASEAFSKMVTSIQEKTGDLMQKIDTDTGRAIQALTSGGEELANASSAIGRGTTLATFTAMIAAALPTIATYVPSPSWTQVGTVVVAFTKNVMVDIPKGVALGAAQNPVVALAIATALMKWRAETAGKTVRELLVEDATMLRDAIARRTTGPGALREVARNVQRVGPRVPLPDPTLQSVQTPSGRATGETTIVQGSRFAADPTASLRALAQPHIPTMGEAVGKVKRQLGFQESSASSASVEDEPLIDVRSSAAAATQPSTPVEDETPSKKRRGSKVKRHGGTVSSKRRKTQGRPSKRRVTRRKAGLQY